MNPDQKILKRIQELIARREQVVGELNAINGGIFELEKQLSTYKEPKVKEVKNG